MKKGDKYKKNQYGYSIFGSDGFIFNEKCKNCESDMKLINSNGRNTMGTTETYWCPKCGTILPNWYDCNEIKDEDWITPKG